MSRSGSLSCTFLAWSALACLALAVSSSETASWAIFIPGTRLKVLSAEIGSWGSACPWATCFASADELLFNFVLLWRMTLCNSWWLVNSDELLKAIMQRWHLNGRSTRWNFLWRVRSDIRVKDMSHRLHKKGLSPMWLLLWTPSSDAVLNRFPQKLHLYGFSPVWVRQWTISSEVVLKHFSQVVHLKGFSPVCILWCTTSSDFRP